MTAESWSATRGGETRCVRAPFGALAAADREALVRRTSTVVRRVAAGRRDVARRGRAERSARQGRRALPDCDEARRRRVASTRGCRRERHRRRAGELEGHRADEPRAASRARRRGARRRDRRCERGDPLHQARFGGPADSRACARRAGPVRLRLGAVSGGRRAESIRLGRGNRARAAGSTAATRSRCSCRPGRSSEVWPAVRRSCRTSRRLPTSR